MGIACVENALKNSKRFMEVPEWLDAKFPAFRRPDAKKWSRWNLYPGAMTVLFPRLIITFMSIMLLGICSSIICWGIDLKVPLTGLRRKLITRVHDWLPWSTMVLGWWASVNRVDITVDDPKADYSEYLGPNWKEELAAY